MSPTLATKLEVLDGERVYMNPQSQPQPKRRFFGPKQQQQNVENIPLQPIRRRPSYDETEYYSQGSITPARARRTVMRTTERGEATPLQSRRVRSVSRLGTSEAESTYVPTRQPGFAT